MASSLVFPLEDSESPIVSVDDDLVFQELLEFVHTRSGLANELKFFQTGRDCLAYFDEITAGRQPLPALVLVDVNMPGLNGFQLVEKLLTMCGDGNPCVRNIHMFTCSPAPDDQDMAAELGVGFYEKPMRMLDIAFADKAAERPAGKGSAG